MTDDPDFDFDPHTAPYSNLTTSLAAAKYVERFVVKGRKIIYGVLLRHGLLSDFDIHVKTGMLSDTIRPRRGELVDAGLVRNSGQTTLSPQSPSDVILWEVVPRPSEEHFVAYMKEMERRKSEVRAVVALHNVMVVTPKGTRRKEKISVELGAEALEALTREIENTKSDRLFDLVNALYKAGFESEGEDPPDEGFGFF